MYTHQTLKGALCFQCVRWPVNKTTIEGRAAIEREEKWPLMRMEDGRILRIAKRNLIKIKPKGR